MTYKTWRKEVIRIFTEEREELFESYSFDWHKAHEYGLSPMEAVTTAVTDDWFDNDFEPDEEANHEAR